MEKLEIILQALDIIIESRIWKDRPPSHTLKILLYMYNKDWLYVPSINNEIQAVIGAYRIPDVTDEILGKLPKNESGTILYIPFVISTRKEDNIYIIVRESMKIYLSKNPDITEIVLEGKDDKLRRYKIGDSNGEVKEPTVTNTANISRECESIT